ncbi:ATP-binding cassette sub-family F member 3-like isoform X3 [Halichondria panicea]|uniref:ATP-binding cassette sub-family F member 3-like isoform X3 n=1 Tax=Halichondria panicea TaxID=6063 RepID=UPI00312B3893
MASGDKNTAAGSASDELAEVYLPLQEIDADKAPARAGCILAGLGFTPQKNEILSGQDTVCKMWEHETIVGCVQCIIVVPPGLK